MSPFLYLVNAAFPGIKISEPYRLTNTRGGSLSGGNCSDYDGTEIDVNSGFDLKSKQLKDFWEQLKTSSGLNLKPDYVENIDGLIESIECAEASLLLNFSRIKKLSELIKVDPSIVNEYDDGSSHIFSRDEIATIAKTFNEKMKDYVERLNKSFDLLSNLSNRAVIGNIELEDIQV
jgi:hypothetical protein